MKKMPSLFAIAAIFAACNSNPKTNIDTAAAVIAADTATLNYNAFTDKAQEVKLNGVSDTIIGNDGNAYVKVKPEEAKAEPVAAPVIREKPAVRKTAATRTRKARSATGGTATSKSETTTMSDRTANGTGTETTTTTTTTTEAPKKKGWSKAAKGTAIGAGTGAVAGAIISKKKGKGAIIGGLIGAGGGYIIGRSKDKKDGRN